MNGFIALLLSVEAFGVVRAWKRRKLLVSDFARAAAVTGHIRTAFAKVQMDRAICVLLVLCGGIKLVSLGSFMIERGSFPYYVTQQDYGVYELDTFTVNDVCFYYPVEGDRVGYDAFPALPRKTEITFRGEGVRSGFRP